VSAAAEAQLRSKSEDRVRRAREAERAATIEAWSLAERVASAQAEVAVQVRYYYYYANTAATLLLSLLLSRSQYTILYTDY